jgi:hypothetical protein
VCLVSPHVGAGCAERALGKCSPLPPYRRERSGKGLEYQGTRRNPERGCSGRDLWHVPMRKTRQDVGGTCRVARIQDVVSRGSMLCGSAQNGGFKRWRLVRACGMPGHTVRNRAEDAVGLIEGRERAHEGRPRYACGSFHATTRGTVTQ